MQRLCLTTDTCSSCDATKNRENQLIINAIYLAYYYEVQVYTMCQGSLLQVSEFYMIRKYVTKCQNNAYSDQEYATNVIILIT